MQSVSVVVPVELARPPPFPEAESAAERAVGQRGRATRCCTGRRRSPRRSLPLKVQSVSVVVPPLLYRPPPFADAEFPLKVQLVSVVVPEEDRTGRRR